jgi:hypothetical protein
MAENWPAVPQAFLTDSYSDGFPDGRLRSSMDRGPDKIRRATSAGVRKISGAIVMTTAELGLFKTFVNVTTIGGSIEFFFSDPLGGPVLLCRFGQNLPTWGYLGEDLWRVSVELEAMP